MANFINKNIVGDGIAVSNSRGFRAIKRSEIGSPVYDAKYFETFPTVWAAAYAFGRELGSNGYSAIMDLAVEEWATLFLLHFFGAVHLRTFSQTELQNHQLYDRDLWLALSGTYPQLGAEHELELDGLHVLETEAGTVVGAYYPETVFFPARGRSIWHDDPNLQHYLSTDDTRLSWQRSRKQLIKTEHDRDSFREHLLLVAHYANALPNNVRGRLVSFCASEFPTSAATGGDSRPTRTLPQHPAQWIEIPGNQIPTPDRLLEAYPLRRQKPDGGYVYYLVDKMPQHEAWMSAQKPAPYQYVAADSALITVQHRRTLMIPCPLRQGLDEIVQLETLFLSEHTSPYWCNAPGRNTHVSLIHPLHRSDVADPRVTQGEKVGAAFLAPVNNLFLRHFPDIAQAPRAVSKTVVTDQSGKVTAVDWKFMLLDHEITWRTRPIYSADLKASSLSIYPPRTSTQWHLYAAHGVGDKNKCGFWNLVDERGEPGELIEVEEDEYVTVLHSVAGPNRPRYLMLTDSEANERGILFLDGLMDVGTLDTSKATLAVDFGTSNTCVAFRNGVSEVLKFSLSPERLWGPRNTEGTAVVGGSFGGDTLTSAAREQPGFAPFSWGGDKGYFPTVLLSRKRDLDLNESLAPASLTLKHLFEIDIPGLHKGLEERLNQGTFNQLWNVHWNLKWEQKDSKSEPWRSLFLQLLMVYAHAEIFFNHGSRLEGYTFTFPLAFNPANQDTFHKQAQEILRKVRHYCYGTDPRAAVPEYVDNVDESTAIALAFRLGDDLETIDVFIDIGGGSTDYAVRYNNRLLVLDSIEVAGRTFFEYGKKNLDPAKTLNGAVQFRRHLGKLIQGKDEAEFKIANPDKRYDLGVAYSVGINALDDKEFATREAALLDRTMGDFSYQQYRTQLFFRHILAYGLLQVCAAVVNERLRLTSGINLVLSGNGWGLLLFADISRKSDALRTEASFVLGLLKRELAPTLDDEQRQCLELLKIYEMTLLNKDDLSTAKTSVALGALKGTAGAQDGAAARSPFAGITVNKLSINEKPPAAIRWYERWGMDEFRSKFGEGIVNITSAKFEAPANTEHPLDPALGVLTLLGNFSGGDDDRLPSSVWKSMNNELSNKYIRGMSGRIVHGTPINFFVSNILYEQDSPLRDFLDQLAEQHGHYGKGK